MTVTELKEELQKLEDQGHGDKPVSLYNRFRGNEPVDCVYVSKDEVNIE